MTGLRGMQKEAAPGNDGLSVDIVNVEGEIAPMWTKRLYLELKLSCSSREMERYILSPTD